MTSIPTDGRLAPARPLGLWLAALFCVLVAAGPAIFYAIVRQSGLLSPAELEPLSPRARYFSNSILYFASAALTGVLLISRSRLAGWAAWLVVGNLWVVQLLSASGWQHPAERPWVVARLAVMAVFGGIALYANHLAKRGVLR